MFWYKHQGIFFLKGCTIYLLNIIKLHIYHKGKRRYLLPCLRICLFVCLGGGVCFCACVLARVRVSMRVFGLYVCYEWKIAFYAEAKYIKIYSTKYLNIYIFASVICECNEYFVERSLMATAGIFCLLQSCEWNYTTTKTNLMFILYWTYFDVEIRQEIYTSCRAARIRKFGVRLCSQETEEFRSWWKYFKYQCVSRMIR